MLGAKFSFDMLRDQCTIMEECFVPRRAPIANLLRGIVQTAEMKIIASMMDDSDKNSKYPELFCGHCGLFTYVLSILFSIGFLKLLQHARENGENNETIEATLVAFKKLSVL